MSAIERLFGTNGFRGVIGRELTINIAVNFGQAVGTYYGGKSIAVGRDGRTSSEMLFNALVSGLQYAGSTIYDLGLLPTPVLQKYVKEHEYLAGGVMITASHNPPEYNGFKVVRSDGVELPDEEEKLIESIFLSKDFKCVDWQLIKPVIKVDDAIQFYVKEVTKLIDLDLIRKRRMKIVADFGHGVSVLSVTPLLSRANCNLISINGEINGLFPYRPPEPTPQNLSELTRVVKGVGAEVGVAFDGDGDRSLICDDEGRVWWGDVIGTLIAKWLAKKTTLKAVVTGINSSCIVEKVLNPLGIKVIRTRVGSRNLTKAMKEHGIIWGFEENGGCLYGPHQYVRDGGMTTMLVLYMLSELNQSLSELCDQLPRFFQVKSKVKVENNELRNKAMKLVKEHYKGMKPIRVEEIDGIKVWFSEDEWILIRPSGTEPIVRIFAESDSKVNAEKLVREAEKVINESIVTK